MSEIQDILKGTGLLQIHLFNPKQQLKDQRIKLVHSADLQIKRLIFQICMQMGPDMAYQTLQSAARHIQNKYIHHVFDPARCQYLLHNKEMNQQNAKLIIGLLKKQTIYTSGNNNLFQQIMFNQLAPFANLHFITLRQKLRISKNPKSDSKDLLQKRASQRGKKVEIKTLRGQSTGLNKILLSLFTGSEVAQFTGEGYNEQTAINVACQKALRHLKD